MLENPENLENWVCGYMASIFYIPLPQGRQTFVDSEDSDLAQYKWCLSRGHVERVMLNGSSRKRIHLHRVILERKLGRPLQYNEETDHINGDPLDNTRNNLRATDHLHNQWNKGNYKNNTSGYKGVTFHSIARKWQAEIMVKGQHIYLGLFDTPEEASQAYEHIAKQYRGEYHRH